MKLEKLFLFSDVIGTFLQKLRMAFSIFKRGLVILCRRQKSLEVTSLQINDSFLISNGLIIINWELKNFLWVRINNKILCTNSKGIMFHFDRMDSPINIKIAGLFGKEEKNFNLKPTATILSNNLISPIINSSTFQMGKIEKSIAQLQLTNLSICFPTTKVITQIKPINISIPFFIKENYHE